MSYKHYKLWLSSFDLEGGAQDHMSSIKVKCQIYACQKFFPHLEKIIAKDHFDGPNIKGDIPRR